MSSACNLGSHGKQLAFSNVPTKELTPFAIHLCCCQVTLRFRCDYLETEMQTGSIDLSDLCFCTTLSKIKRHANDIIDGYRSINESSLPTLELVSPKARSNHKLRARAQADAVG